MANEPIKTVAGNWYSFTCTAPATVTAEIDGESVTLATLDEGGATAICSPSATVTVETEGKYRLLPTKAPAAASVSNSSGGAIQEQIATALQAALFDEEPMTLRTPEGNGDANVQWMELDAQHVPQGRLVSVSLRARSGNNPATQSYLAVWELGEDGTTWSYLGSSSNNPGQMMNRVATWEFGGEVRLSGRKVRLLAQAEPSGLWVVERELGCRVLTPLPEGDGSKVVYQGASHSYLPQIIFCYEEAQPRFTPAAHVGDASHLTEQEREAWNAKADASVLAAKVNSSTFNAHVANATLHVSAEEHAGLEELLARKDELLALLNAGQAQAEDSGASG